MSENFEAIFIKALLYHFADLVSKLDQGVGVVVKEREAKDFTTIVFPKRAKYIRRANRIYSLTEFKDGELLTYYGSALSPSSDAEGYRYYKGESGIRLVHWRDIVEYEESER